MKPHIRRALAYIRREEIPMGKAEPPLREDLHRRRTKEFNISLENMALLADVSPATIQSVENGRNISPEMLVYLNRVLDETVWDPRREAYARVRDGRVVAVPKRQPTTNGGWHKSGTRRASVERIVQPRGPRVVTEPPAEAVAVGA